MNARSDFDRTLRHWFDDGPSEMPDRVIDGIAARIARQPQRRTWRLPGRHFMNTYTKLVAAAAAIVIVGFVGWQLLPGTAGPGSPTTAPTPSAQPTAAVTAAPSVGVACPEWFTTGCSGGAGILTAGSHATRTFDPGFTFSVPAGWVNSSDSRDYFELFRTRRPTRPSSPVPAASPIPSSWVRIRAPTSSAIRLRTTVAQRQRRSSPP